MRITPLGQFKSDSKNRMPLHFLWRGIWRFIFDEMSCGLNHRTVINDEIMKWHKLVEYQKKIRTEAFGPEAVGTGKVGTNGNIIDEAEYNIQAMAHFLVRNEMGGFERTKQLLKLHKIDYKRYILCREWFPECQPKDAEKKAQAALEVNKKEFPELYPDKNNRIEGLN